MTAGLLTTAERSEAASRIGMDAATVRRLLVHEAQVHALPGRRLRDLGDAVLLHDETDPDPFWNRLEAIDWPDDATAFDRHLDAAIVLFSTLGRRPHIWPSAAYDRPPDTVARLLASGFEDVGAGELMALVDRRAAVAAAEERAATGVTLDRLRLPQGDLAALAGSITDVLVDAFDVEPARAPGLRAETQSALGQAVVTHFLVRIGGEPVAVARSATFEGCTYLSSIGTRTWARGRGLGRLVTSHAVVDAIDAGSDWIHLGVFSENLGARRLYERLGFATIGGAVPDLLLIR
jgi:ribosomal protein S18 acetylase RimI-like enzyme